MAQNAKYYLSLYLIQVILSYNVLTINLYKTLVTFFTALSYRLHNLHTLVVGGRQGPKVKKEHPCR